jgi:hypothetical protein
VNRKGIFKSMPLEDQLRAPVEFPGVDEIVPYLTEMYIEKGSDVLQQDVRVFIEEHHRNCTV